MPPELEIITGVYDRCRWTSPDADSHFGFHFLADGTVVGGEAEPAELVRGVPYQFFGKWKADTGHGKTFMFKQFIQQQPVSREGMIGYLCKYTNLGEGTCAKIIDEYGQDSIGVLRTQPRAVQQFLVGRYGNNRYYAIERLDEASGMLRQRQGTESARLALTDLLLGRGFQTKLIDLAIQKWGLLAAARIRRDPFCLLTANLPSAGFARCDKLWMDLGLPPDRMKRQVVCLWYLIQNDSSGNTWLPYSLLHDLLFEKISGCVLKPNRAVKIGVKANWLAKRRDGDGVLWLSTHERAEAEATVAKCTMEILWHEWEPALA